MIIFCKSSIQWSKVMHLDPTNHDLQISIVIPIVNRCIRWLAYKYSMVAVCIGSSNFRPFLQHLANKEKKQVLEDGKHQSAQSQQSVKSKNVLQRLSYQRFSARKTTSSNSSKVQHPMGIIHSTHKYVWLWFFWSVVKNQFWDLHVMVSAAHSFVFDMGWWL